MRITERFPLWLRLTHWLNVVFLTAMIWSGLQIYWANDVYKPFFPQWFYSDFAIGHRLAEGLYWHFALAWLFSINGLIYATGLLVTGEWRALVPRPQDFRGALQTVLHDLRLGPPPAPQGKINSAQRFAYSGVIVMGAASIATGLAIYKPRSLLWLTAIFGGYEQARLFHFILTMLYLAFTVVHVAQVARAGWTSLRSMVAGFEVKP